MLEQPHNDPNMGTMFLKVLGNFNICDRILSITLDNTRNNNMMIESINIRTRISFLVLFYIRCVAHILNLAVQDNLKKPMNVYGKFVQVASYWLKCS